MWLNALFQGLIEGMVWEKTSKPIRILYTIVVSVVFFCRDRQHVFADLPGGGTKPNHARRVDGFGNWYAGLLPAFDENCGGSNENTEIGEMYGSGF